MRTFTHIFASLVAFRLAFSTPIPSDPLESRATCPTYMIIEAPGLGDASGTWTYPTTQQLLKALSGGERYLLKTAPPPDDGPNTAGPALIEGAAEGSTEIVATVATTFASCPDTKIVLFGYSYGTIEVVLAMNDPAMIRAPIAAVIMYGNCFWHAGRIENQGTATSGTSVCGGTEGVGTPLLFEDVTADFCLFDDYLCTGTPYSLNRNLNSHWNYKNSQWQTDAVNYIVGRVKANNNLPVVT